MSRNANLLYEIIRELRSIIKELDAISNGIRTDFQGIGNEKCARVISEVNSRYNTALSKLNQIDASKL